jgi:hypothetical protein
VIGSLKKSAFLDNSFTNEKGAEPCKKEKVTLVL